MVKQSRDALLACTEEYSSFSKHIASLKSEHNTTFGEWRSKHWEKLISSISDIIQELNHKKFNTLWSNVFKLTRSALHVISEASSESKEDNKGDEIMTELNESVETLQGICILLLGCVNVKEPTISEAMIETMILLHGSIFDLHHSSPSLASCICLICGKWTKKSLRSHEKFCLYAMTYSLRCLHESKCGNLREIYEMQNCLKYINFKLQPDDNLDDATFLEMKAAIEELEQSLLECFAKNIFLKDPDGRKFLSLIMLLDEDILKDAHLVLMKTCKDSQGEAVGSIYFQAWRIATDEMRKPFEEICIQDIMYRAVHAPRGKTNNLFPRFRAILQSVVCNKGSSEVRHMISRLYSPILWRSLEANNTMVRANACTLLFDAFPLEEEDSRNLRAAENKEFMQRQFDAINSMLLDACPQIRIIGILGICDLLHMYWDAVPAHVIAIFTKNLYNTLAFDATSTVRHAVFKGTLILLNTACAHPILGKLLPPCVEKCLHDMNEKVRFAVADVLLAVKRTCSIAFWDVCPLPNILAQLEIDGEPVSKQLVKLLLHSFLPEDKSPQVWVERCASFYKRSVGAARKFYMMIDKEISIQETGQFLNLIGIFITNCLTKTLEQSDVSTGSLSSLSIDENGGEENDPQSNIPVIETSVLAGLLDTACILWKNLDRRMPSAKSGKNRELRKKIMITYSRTIRTCLKVSCDERCLNAVLLLSTYLPPASLPVFSQSILPKLRSLGEDVPELHYSMLIHCMCAWDWSKQFLDMVNEWISESTKDFQRAPNQVPQNVRRSVRLSKSTVTEGTGSKKKSKKKMVSFVGVKDDCRPAQALKYLSSFLEIQSRTSFSTFDKPQILKAILSAASYLKKCQDEIVSRILKKAHSEGLWSDDLLVEGLNVHCNILTTIYLCKQEKIQDLELQNEEDNTAEEESEEVVQTVTTKDLEEVIDWFQVVMKKYKDSHKPDPNTSILSSQQPTGFLASFSLFRQVATSVLQFCFNLLSCGVPLFEKVEEILFQFTESGISMVECTGIVTRLIHELHEHHALLLDFNGETREEEIEQQNECEVDSKSNEKMICIYDSFLSSLLQHARQNPDSFIKLFRHDVRQPLRAIVREQFLIHSVSPHLAWYEALVRKTVSAILADLFNEIKSSSNYSARDRISELPYFSGSLASVVFTTSGECKYICETVIADIVDDPSTFVSDDKNTIVQTFARLIYTLCKDCCNQQAARNCKAYMVEHLSGFGDIYSKVEKNEDINQDEKKLSDIDVKEGTCKEENKQLEKEEILLLEDPDQPPMCMDDEEMVV